MSKNRGVKCLLCQLIDAPRLSHQPRVANENFFFGKIVTATTLYIGDMSRCPLDSISHFPPFKRCEDYLLMNGAKKNHQ